MPSEMSRRQLLQASAFAGVTVALSRGKSLARTYAANEKLNVGVIGVANQGRFSLDNVRSQNIVALCDIDDNYLAAAAKELPEAKCYSDFRLLMDQKDVEAVTVGTPDHTHAPATLWALRSGRHVYCEKPLTHNIAEVRQVMKAARQGRRATQMGTQIHAGDNYRRVVEVIQSGAIGPIREVHVWVGSVWSGGDARPTDTPPIPPNIHWDLWLGPAPERPYHPTYIPARWRGWWDFGGGALADMACHHIDLSHWSLGLRYPTTVEAEGPPLNSETAPPWLIVRYQYPARGDKPPVSLTWYNGDKRPHYFAEGKLPEWGNGSLFVGEKGMLLADYGQYRLLPEAEFAGYQPPKPSIPKSIGHHNEWIEACKHGTPTTCNFDYAGALTETVLLGNVSYRLGRKVEWDSRRMKAKGCPEADVLLSRTYRKGWEMPEG